MKTVNVNGKQLKVKYRTNSEMRTIAKFNGRMFKQGLSCDVYNVKDGEHVALILNSVNGDLLKSATVISVKEYEEISDLYDPYAKGQYHTACLEKCGAENHLHLA